MDKAIRIIEHYRRKLLIETDPAQRRMLLRLLTDEEAKLEALRNRLGKGTA